MKKVLFQTVLLKGEAGNSIVSVTHKSTQGRTEVYTITLSDGSTYDYSVVNGNGIASIEKTSTEGYVDTYTITLTDGTTTTFNVTNGVVVDEALNVNSTNPVQNKIVAERIAELTEDSETLNERTDENDLDITTLFNSIIPSSNIQDSAIATKTYYKGAFLIMNGKLYKVTATIHNGGTIEVGTNVAEISLTTELVQNRGNVYRYSTTTEYIGDLASWESTVIDAVNFTDTINYLGSGFWFGGASIETDKDYILTGYTATADNTLRVTLHNCSSSTISNISITVYIWFYKPTSAN